MRFTLHFIDTNFLFSDDSCRDSPAVRVELWVFLSRLDHKLVQVSPESAYATRLTFDQTAAVPLESVVYPGAVHHPEDTF